jgi:hypothetical protein
MNGSSRPLENPLYTGPVMTPADDESLNPFTALLAALPATEEELPKVLVELADGNLVDPHSPGFAGFVRGLYARFEAAEVWTKDLGEKILDESAAILAPEAGPPPDTLDWNPFYALNWLAARNDAELIELIRRARHRDGSTQSISTSSGALAALADLAIVPELQPALARLGFDPSSVGFGNFPRGGAAASPATGTGLSGGLSRSQVSSVPMSEVVLPLSAVVEPDLVSGMVRLGTNALSLSAAVRFAAAIGAAVRSMLLPAEGFVWLDDSFDPLSSSSLLVLDSALSSVGLPVVVGPGNDGTASLHGEVKQGADGQYRGTLYRHDGSVLPLMAEYTEMETAKFAVADEIRRLAKP